jgi:hypothetical protein
MRRPRTRPPPTTPGGGRPELRPGAAVSCVRRLDVGSPIDFAGKGTPVSDDPPVAPSPPPPSIGDYGLLGDTRTAALVSSDGAIDWLCVPRFDGEPVFGRLVGGPPAGTFRVGPARPAPVLERRYRQHTATLVTTWVVGERRLTLIEAMVAEVAGRLLPATVLVRRLSAEGGAVDAAVEFDPRLGEHHRPPRIRRGRRAVVCQWGSLAVFLGCTPGLSVEPGRPHRSRSRRIDRSPWCWPWPIANRSSTSTRRRRGIFDPAKGSYTRSCGSDDLDAALLVLPLLGIEDAESARVRGTIDAIRKELSAGGPLLYRYPPGRDGLPGTEGAFLPCSFWLVQALASTGRHPRRSSCSGRCSITPTRSASTPKRWTRDRSPPRQLPADTDPRRAHPSRTCPTRHGWHTGHVVCGRGRPTQLAAKSERAHRRTTLLRPGQPSNPVDRALTICGTPVRAWASIPPATTRRL